MYAYSTVMFENIPERNMRLVAAMSTLPESMVQGLVSAAGFFSMSLV